MVYSICAHTAVSFPLLITIGVATGFFSALLGVGGGLIMVPFLIAVGISSDVAGASSVAITCGTAFTGVLAYKKIGNVNLKIGLNITAGAIVGGICGVLLTKALRISGNFDLVIHLLFLILLLF
ncbi:MAG: sulfite exporter TauE/SafE family protein, partial [Desulfurellaceae bacterium]|nr:sulfite exporter TauE/SafE family protein [Desulfurellaceae bacterium]